MDKPIKLFKAIPSVKSIAGVLPGTVLEADSASGLKVATGQGVLEVQEIQPPGKKRMSACSWIRGRGTEVGQRFQ
jgi:methionyl-tRNA formyltransferase